MWTLVLLAGCVQTETEAPASMAMPTPVTFATQAEPEIRPALKADREGPVVMRMVRGLQSSVVLLTSAGFIEDPQGVRDLARAPDGSVWALGLDGRVWNVDGPESFEVGCLQRPTQVAVDGRGRVWVANGDAIARWDHTTCVVSTYAELVGEQKLSVQDLIVDHDGNTWLSSLTSVYRYDGSWSEVRLPLGELTTLPGQLAAGPDGVEIGTVHGAYRWEQGAWAQAVEGDVRAGIDVNAGARVMARSGGSVRVEHDGERAEYSVEGARSIESASVDARGRAWVAADTGLHALGWVRTGYLLASDPVLKGRIAQVMVVGAGPSILPPSRSPLTSQVKAVFTRNGRPLSNASVELCPLPVPSREGSPCHGAALGASTRTDAAGNAVFEAVPRTQMRLVFQADGTWRDAIGAMSACCAGAEDLVDLGKVELSAN